MSAPAPSTRRLAVAIGTAVASATLALGVTAASLLGWFSPAAALPDAPEPAAAPAAPAPGPVILVPVTPTPAPLSAADVQLAMDDRPFVREDDHEDDHDDDDHDDDDHDDDDHDGGDDDD